MLCFLYIGKMDIFYQYCSDTARGDAMSGKIKNKNLPCQVIIYNIYSVFGQIKSQINRHSPADSAQIVDGPPMLQCGYVLGIRTYIYLPSLQETKKGKFSSALTLPNQAALQQGICPYMATLHLGAWVLATVRFSYCQTCIHAHTLLNY